MKFSHHDLDQSCLIRKQQVRVSCCEALQQAQHRWLLHLLLPPLIAPPVARPPAFERVLKHYVVDDETFLLDPVYLMQLNTR